MAEDARPLRADARRNRERVLAAAEEILARDGLAASMRDIAARAGVGLATIYRQFPAKEDLYQEVVLSRVRGLLDEARELSDADDPGGAFFLFFGRVVEDATHKKVLVDALADAGINVKSGMSDLSRQMVEAIGGLLARAQAAGAVRPDLAMPELLAVLSAACLGAERNQWPAPLRARVLALVLDGLRP